MVKHHLKEIDLLCQQIAKAKGYAANESIATAQQRIAENFHLLEEGTERYDHLISLGRALAPMADDHKIAGNHLRDCRGDAWLSGSYKGDFLILNGAAESDMIAGLIAIVVDVYSGHTPEEVLAHPLSIESLGLTSCLSPHRLSCLQGILQRVRNLAMLARVQGNA